MAHKHQDDFWLHALNIYMLGKTTQLLQLLFQ